MTHAEHFTLICHAIFGDDDHWQQRAAMVLKVRPSTIGDWSTGRRSFNPDIFHELKTFAECRRDTFNWAALQAAQLFRSQQ